MLQEYNFFREDTLKFENSKTVKELLEYAFKQYGYYEPFGMDTVTIYQANIPHFTLDTSRKCYEEIKDPDGLCFAYYIPGFLYYAEGGWGHHMAELSNHPVFNHPISLKLRFIDFNHTVVFEGSHSFREVLNLLKKVGYISDSISQITIQVLAYPKPNYTQHIDCSDAILDAPMTVFDEMLPTDGIVTLVLEEKDNI